MLKEHARAAPAFSEENKAASSRRFLYTRVYTERFAQVCTSGVTKTQVLGEVKAEEEKYWQARKLRRRCLCGHFPQ
jgi:hypothetical protein